ncbi:MAG: ribosome biogenesis GTPase Der [Candidatus Komeilibacteria bacterium]|nr:ribosome biogenesis GTPase Der [Candidatus Komeilibacteria bacterium]
MNNHRIAIVGRANVGKSTLFNKLTETSQALVSSVPGTTRDRLTGICLWRGEELNVVDTGGMDINPNDPIEKQIAFQAEKAIKEADLILLVVNIRDGLMPADRQLANLLKKGSTPIILVTNKADSAKHRTLATEFYRLGVGEPQPVSASNGSGIGDLLDIIVEHLTSISPRSTRKKSDNLATTRPLRMMFLGQPNAGKSSLVNAILREERVIVSDQPHTTRGVQIIDFNFHDKNYEILDTAGLRRKRRNSGIVEKFSIEQIKDIIHSVDLAILVLDISRRITVQDKKIASLIKEKGRSCIIVANKWDLVEDKETNTINDYTADIYDSLPLISYAPIIFTSAVNEQRVHKLLELAQTVYSERWREIMDNAADKFLKSAIKKNLPKKAKGTRHPYIIGFKQVDVNPPRFVLRLDARAPLHQAYFKYLEKQLRLKFGYLGTPIFIEEDQVDLKHKHRDKLKFEDEQEEDTNNDIKL